MDEVAAQAPAGVQVQVLWDRGVAQGQGKQRADGSDLRVLHWDSTDWREVARTLEFSAGNAEGSIIFRLLGVEAGGERYSGDYYVYYGSPLGSDSPLVGDEREGQPLLLALGDEQGVEWGPEVTWEAQSAVTQTLVSSDGRIVLEHPPGGLERDVRVRLRTVPVSEQSRLWPLPDYEFHADPLPGVLGSGQVGSWEPPVTVSINWAGLPVAEDDLRGRVHFVYDTIRGTWRAVAMEFDPGTGVMRVRTDQP
jgi:hypothetical protein